MPGAPHWWRTVGPTPLCSALWSFNLPMCCNAAKALVFLLVSMCWDAAQTLAFLPVSVCYDTAQTLAFLLVSRRCDTAKALVVLPVFLWVSVCWDTAQALVFLPVSKHCDTAQVQGRPNHQWPSRKYLAISSALLVVQSWPFSGPFTAPR